MNYLSVMGSRIAAAGVMLMLAGAPVAAAEFSDSQKAEIDGLIGEYLKKNPEFIRDYLLENPEILLEISSKLRAKQVAEERENALQAMAEHRTKLERDPMTPVTGNPDGDVTLVEFFDYNCVYCKRVFPFMRDIANADPNIRVVWKEYPILTGRFPTSLTAAKAAVAANMQGKYIETHQAFMAVRGSLSSDAQVFKIAEEVGLDVARLKRDMESPEVKNYLAETTALGAALNFQGTPALVIDGAAINGAVPAEVILAVIAAARADALQPGKLEEADLQKIMQQFGS